MGWDKKALGNAERSKDRSPWWGLDQRGFPKKSFVGELGDGRVKEDKELPGGVLNLPRKKKYNEKNKNKRGLVSLNNTPEHPFSASVSVAMETGGDGPSAGKHAQ